MKKFTTSIMEQTVEENVIDILDEYNLVEPFAKRMKKVIGGNKPPKNTFVVPFDNISFHSEESVSKWRFVFHWIIALGTVRWS